MTRYASVDQFPREVYYLRLIHAMAAHFVEIAVMKVEEASLSQFDLLPYHVACKSREDV
jgi:hypothetical protein